jgi:pyrroloquinoline quinone biosynthesis protein D
VSDSAEALRVPAFRRGVKFRFDTARDAWLVLAPERLFVPDEPAVEVLKLVDGVRTLAAITDDLCARFDAPADVIMPDVVALLDDLADKGVVTW